MILRHVALACSSEEKSDKFYQDLLGLQKSEPKTIPAALSQALFDIDSELKIINYLDENLFFEIFVSDRNSGGAKRVDHVCLQTDDLNALLERCRRLQVKILQVPKGNKLLTFISDDDGNLFEIINSRS
jgi:catechol 2,3-dioxygenase-like lactoylglutathione lyase family enzyme